MHGPSGCAGCRPGLGIRWCIHDRCRRRGAGAGRSPRHQSQPEGDQRSGAEVGGAACPGIPQQCRRSAPARRRRRRSAPAAYRAARGGLDARADDAAEGAVAAVVAVLSAVAGQDVSSTGSRPSGLCTIVHTQPLKLRVLNSRALLEAYMWCLLWFGCQPTSGDGFTTSGGRVIPQDVTASSLSATTMKGAGHHVSQARSVAEADRLRVYCSKSCLSPQLLVRPKRSFLIGFCR
mmetsp:Transcript_74629/g.242445  ORF Transcript_74629/g.242445 Transcript_74629/m.242445 type:complete len:234 (+) Transcript_74629:841-1542(+)